MVPGFQLLAGYWRCLNVVDVILDYCWESPQRKMLVVNAGACSRNQEEKSEDRLKQRGVVVVRGFIPNLDSAVYLHVGHHRFVHIKPFGRI